MINIIRINRLAAAIALILSAATLAACHSMPPQNPSVAAARADLTALQNDPSLANRASAAIGDAEAAVQVAEKPQKDVAVGDHLAYIAVNKVKTARALASSRYTEDQLKTVSGQQDQIRLAARTQEADQARLKAESAKLAAAAAERNTALAVQKTADAERNITLAEQKAAEAERAAASAEQQTDEAKARAMALEKELADLHAKKTDRGMVFTLSDVLFATGKADLKSGAAANFGRLAEALKKNPDQRVTVEGHTDDVGSDESNLSLSQRRAEAVKSYLVSQGVDAGLITATGKGEGFPVTSNSTASGRQKNRRVEVIIEN